MSAYQTLIIEKQSAVALIRLNRPQVLNALNEQTMNELKEALAVFDLDREIGAIVITGNDKAFAAGADVSEMVDLSFIDAFESNFITRNWDAIATIRKPVIAAVSGYALGGGCELAMMCDIIICSETAKFGQPEITLGIIPGAGGTQRLPRRIGLAKAMDLCLTGRMMDAQEAERHGLVSRVVEGEGQYLEESLKAAQKIASYSSVAVKILKESIRRSQEVSLEEGLLFERRNFHSLFATEDQEVGMRAFLDKKKPEFKNK